MKIYIVKSITGEYEDIFEFDVCAFTEEKLAKEFVERQNQWAQKENVYVKNNMSLEECLNFYKLKNMIKNPEDTISDISFPGIEYKYTSLELKE